jgi:hypothetical protein
LRPYFPKNLTVISHKLLGESSMNVSQSLVGIVSFPLFPFGNDDEIDYILKEYGRGRR